MPVRKENVFGLPVTVGTPDELRELVGDNEAMHMMIRCTDAAGDRPYPALDARRRRMPCEGCREICWYDPDSIVDPTATFLCPQCVIARGGEISEALASGRMVDEVQREFRRPDGLT
jgi:hypothetical protein